MGQLTVNYFRFNILAPNMLIFKIIISTQNRVNGQPDFNAKAGLTD